MGIVNTGLSAIGKLAAVGLLLTAFLASMASVVYMSLSGEEITVPEITGKDFVESEKELAALGLKIKRRADRESTEKMNTVLEQLPKAGETVKSGQLIFVVVSKAGIESEEKPKSLIKDLETDDSEKIEEMISEKPKKPKANTNSNSKKKADTARDVNTASSNADSGSGDKSNSKSDNLNKKGTDSGKETGDKSKSNSSAAPAPKQQVPPAKPAMREQKPRNQR